MALRFGRVLVFVAVCWFSGGHLSAQAEPIVIIVNKQNPVDNLTARDIARFYMGEVTDWSSGESIVAINRPIESEVRRRFYRVVLNAAPTNKYYQSGSPIPFETVRVESENAVPRFVARQTNAIAYCYQSVVDQSVKVLKINGLAPGEDGYPLR